MAEHDVHINTIFYLWFYCCVCAGEYQSTQLDTVVRLVVDYFQRHNLQCFDVCYRLAAQKREVHGHVYIVKPKHISHSQHLGMFIHYPLWLPLVWPNPRSTSLC